jgi:hypothetical protein
MDKEFRHIYKISELGMGDRFYFADDRHKNVWEIISDNSCMHLTDMKIFRGYELVVFLRRSHD